MPYLHMDGPAVFKFAVKALSDIAEKTLDEAGVAQADVDWLVPHQANLRIIESTAKHLKLSMDKVIVTLPEQGNTSAASIPLAFDCAVRDGRIQRGQTVLLEGIGGGFAWGAVLLRF
ncbi:3-oxoacyl-[acyl-carrier-protein] synthase 3 [compost metagenome]